MKLHKTATHRTPEANSAASITRPSTDEATEPNHSVVQLMPVPANGRTESGSPHVDIVIQPNTILRAKDRGFSEHFVRMIKTICSLALGGFRPSDIVNSPMLCAEIRYGLRKDAFVDGGNGPGLDKGERLNAGRVIWLLADAGELPLESLGRNSANLQQYRVK